MNEDQKALEELRKIFSDYLDLEQELYQKFEDKLDKGILVKYSFDDSSKVDFLKFLTTCSFFQILKGSAGFLDEGHFLLRKNLTRPWFLGKDFINLELTIGNFSQVFTNESLKKIPDFFCFRDLLHQIKFSADNIILSDSKNINMAAIDLARELKRTRTFSLKFTRTKKDASNFRLSIEQENNIFDSDSYRQRLDRRFRDRVKEVVQDSTSLYGEILRLHLQKRLLLWGYQFKGLLEPQDLIKQYEKISLSQIFPSIVDSALFIDYITFNENEEVLNQIDKDPYKQQLLKQLNWLDLNQAIELEFTGVNMESNPEFKIKD